MDVAAFGPARFEGRVPYMYLDTAGNVTVGIGHMLATAGAAGRPMGYPQAFGAWAMAISIARTIIRAFDHETPHSS